MPVSAIVRERTNLSSLVYNELKLAIIEGRLMPGSLVNEEELAGLLGVSRTPVREAVVQLEREELVTSSTAKGRFVTSITQQQHRGIVEAYEALQTYALRTAVSAIPDDEIDRVQALLDEEAGKIAEGDVEAHFRTDRAVHRLITRYGNNAVIERLVENLMSQTFRYYATTHRSPGSDHIHHAYNEHRDILAAIRQRDGTSAERLLREHLQRSYERTSARFREPSEAQPPDA